MTDETEWARTRGVRASELLNNPLMVEAFDKTKAEYIAAWEATPARDAEAREKLWIMVKLIDKVRGHLSNVLDEGRIADAHLVEIEKQRKFRVFG